MPIEVEVTGSSLYKRDSRGNIRQWYMELGREGTDFYTRVVAGLQGGSVVESGWKLATPKNVGRANETTSEEQAKAEINSLYTKKQDKDYAYLLEEVDKVKMTKPMLAHDYTKNKDSVLYPLAAQPKLDGIRCLARADGLWTRTGKQITSCDHVFEALKRVFEKFPNVIIDGELYNHDLKEDFNTITSLVRKQKQSPKDIETCSQLVQYHVYDIVNQQVFEDRMVFLKDISREVGNDVVHFVQTEIVPNAGVLDNLYGEWLQDGYEGQIIRSLSGLYAGNRSKNLLKRKEFATSEFEVVAMLEGEGNWAGCTKHLRLKMDDGREFQSGMRGNDQLLRNMWNNQACPKWATIRYFSKLTPDGFPRFPVAVDWGFESKRND